MISQKPRLQEKFKARLLAERSRIAEEINQEQGRLLLSMDERDRYGNHPGDEGTETFEKEKNLAIQSSLEVMLGEIDHALRKFEQGTYGMCDDCGGKIPEERLAIRPQAALCVSCKSKAEHDTHLAQRQPPGGQ